VLGVEPKRIGGAEMFCRELSEQLGRHGWDSVLCFESDPPEHVRRYMELPNVKFEKLKNAWRGSRQATRGLATLLRRHRPAILHAGFTPFLSAYPWVGRLCGVRQYYFTDHGSQPIGYEPARAPALKRLAARIINWPLTRVLCVSDFNARTLAARDIISAKRIYRLYDGTYTNRTCGDATEFRRKHGIPGGRIVISQVCWIIPEKGIDDVIEAAKIVVGRNPAVHFVMVGEGAYRAKYTELARAAGLEGHVTWTGLVGDPLGEGVYATADIVCQASRWQEAFGWVIAEAMVCGRPVVATRVGGIPEVVADGVSGFLVPHANPQALAEKLLMLAEDPELRARMGQAGRGIVESKFNLSRIVEELLSLYGVV
jgi:glycosyltransferase involved in cell wall biosynthesis